LDRVLFRLEQIRRRWWVVLVFTVSAVLVVAASLLLSHTTYVGKSALMLSGRVPEQDAVMALGYLTLFNDPATIARLRTTTKIPEDVTFEARVAAASPILRIEATADDPRVAQDAAQAMTEAFRDDINSVRRRGAEEYIADIERQIQGTSPFSPDGSGNPYYTTLQQRIETARGDSTDELQDLQLRAGVTESTPNIMLNLLLGAVGGLLLGVIVALGLAELSNAVRTEGPQSTLP